jgi:hypothetical protein
MPFPYEPLENTPFDPRQPRIKSGPKFDSKAVRVDGTMISLQANNLSQDLLRFHWSIASG